MEVLEQLQATFAVRRLEHRDLGVVAVEADRGVGPLSTDRATAGNAEPKVGEEGDRLFEVADRDADVHELDGNSISTPVPRVVRAADLRRPDDENVGPLK